MEYHLLGTSSLVPAPKGHRQGVDHDDQERRGPERRQAGEDLKEGGLQQDAKRWTLATRGSRETGRGQKGFGKQSKTHTTDKRSQSLGSRWARVGCLVIIHYWNVILPVYSWNILGI